MARQGDSLITLGSVIKFTGKALLILNDSSCQHQLHGEWFAENASQHYCLFCADITVSLS